LGTFLPLGSAGTTFSNACMPTGRRSAVSFTIRDFCQASNSPMFAGTMPRLSCRSRRTSNPSRSSQRRTVFSLRLNHEAISFEESGRLPGCSPTAFVAFGFRGGPSLLAITQLVKQDPSIAAIPVNSGQLWSNRPQPSSPVADCRVAGYKRPYHFGEDKRLVDFAKFRNPNFPSQEESRCFAFTNRQRECLLFVPQFS
jgi:hypothetical protein